MAKVKFPSEMPSANNIGGNDKMMISKGTGETYQATFDQAKQYLSITGIDLEPLTGGTQSAPTIVPDGPAGEIRKAQAGPGWYKINGVDTQAVEGRLWSMFWNGTAWSLKDLGAFPEVSKTDVIEENNADAITSRGVYPLKSAFKALGVILKGDAIATSSDMTWLSGRLLNNVGNVASTVQDCSVSTNYFPLDSRLKKIKVFTKLTGTGLHIATYSEPAQGKQNQIVALTNETSPNEFEITLTENDKFIRVSCWNGFIENFKIIALEVDNSIINADSTNMLLNELYAVNSVTKNSDGIISSAEVTWQDGVVGMLTYEDYNTVWRAYDSYKITYLNKIVSQPRVTRDDDGTIINSPLKQII